MNDDFWEVSREKGKSCSAILGLGGLKRVTMGPTNVGDDKNGKALISVVWQQS